MPPLLRRGRCCVCAGCGSFLSSNSNNSTQLGPNYARLILIPLDPHERCAACGHPYFNHRALVSAPSTTDPARKGGCTHTLCGGFIPQSPAGTWSPRLLCICTEAWATHDLLDEPDISPQQPAFTYAAPAQTQIAPSLPPPLNLLSRPSLPPPISSVFTGPASSAAAASTNANRQEAIVRHFGSRPRKYRPPQPYPGNTSLASPPFEVLIALWPNVLRGSSYQPPGAFPIDCVYTSDEFSDMLKTLKDHGLVFVASLSGTGDATIIPEITTQLATHLAQHGLILPPAPRNPRSVEENAVTAWTRLPWIVLSAVRRRDVWTWSQHPNVNANNFNHKMIRDLNNKYSNPLEDYAGKLLLMLGPRFGNVQGRLPESWSSDALGNAIQLDSLHACFGQRLLHGLEHSGVHYDEIDCHPGLCPDPPATRNLRRPREQTPKATVASSSRVTLSIVMSLIEVLLSEDEEVPTITPSATSSSDSVIFADGPAIVGWQRQVAASVSSVSDSEQVLIDGANVTVMAQYIVDILTFLRQQSLGNTSARFPTPHGIHNPRTTMTLLSFVQREYRRSYHIGNTVSGRSVGRGLERSVWRKTMELVVQQSPFWQPSPAEPEYHTFLFSPITSGSAERSLALYVHGQILSLYLYYYGQGLAVGLWPILALVLGRDSMLLAINNSQSEDAVDEPGISAQSQPSDGVGVSSPTGLVGGWLQMEADTGSVVAIPSCPNTVIDPGEIGPRFPSPAPDDPAADLVRQIRNSLSASGILPVLGTNAGEEGPTNAAIVPSSDEHDMPPLINMATDEVEIIHRETGPTHIYGDSSGPPPAETVCWIAICVSADQDSLYCVPGPVMIPDSRSQRSGAVIEFLVAQGGAPGRALRTLLQVEDYRVGISRVPEDITGDFRAVTNGFIEVGGLNDLYSSPMDSPRIHHARESELRSAVLDSLGYDDLVPLFVLYVYKQLTQILNQDETTGALVPDVAPLLATIASSAGAANACNSYLETYFSSRRQQLNAVLNAPGYQSAYKHCVTERQIMSVCNSLGIIFTARQILGADVHHQGIALTIRPDDIAAWMGVSSGQLATCRTEVGITRIAHRILRQVAAAMRQGLSVEPPMEPRHDSFLATLNAMMSDRILAPLDPGSGYIGARELPIGEANAVRMKIATLKNQVTEVRALWAAQFDSHQPPQAHPSWRSYGRGNQDRHWRQAYLYPQLAEIVVGLVKFIGHVGRNDAATSKYLNSFIKPETVRIGDSSAQNGDKPAFSDSSIKVEAQSSPAGDRQAWQRAAERIVASFKHAAIQDITTRQANRFEKEAQEGKSQFPFSPGRASLTPDSPNSCQPPHEYLCAAAVACKPLAGGDSELKIEGALSLVAVQLVRIGRRSGTTLVTGSGTCLAGVSELGCPVMSEGHAVAYLGHNNCFRTQKNLPTTSHKSHGSGQETNWAEMSKMRKEAHEKRGAK
ncbi:hypothetical protein GGX14DRAFT_402031 [Mycena pura]|uniref:Uncharacterized protein n=1 Tax=Mycena pura TaxID=153505 RepID=A0AAD6V681_9AGAR|nr:hypothetical protein GGX14DRAFT_402031 [Mycena pura]